MSYQALYRVHRPDRFATVVGQKSIVQTLKNQVISGRIAHAYLFCGTHGTGKTTFARIFSRAINCQQPHAGDPCGVCASCVALATPSTLDILELDAASNNGVDQVRELTDRIAYPPQTGKYKVYIIDEVHMLSTAAFNALLKTLEEPPAHAVFILATTDPQKLPATVLSRCQRYDFKRITSTDIAAYLHQILEGMGISADMDALYEIARAADGAMRDALSLTDLCLSYAGEGITKTVVDEALGITGSVSRFAFGDALATGDVSCALHILDDLMRAGRDPAVFSREMASHLRGVLFASACPDCAQMLDVSQDDAQRFVAQAQLMGAERALRAMEIFLTTEGEMRWASQPRIQLEMAAVRACRPSLDQSFSALTERIDALERKLATGQFTAAPRTANSANPNAVPAPIPRIAASTQQPPENQAAQWKEVTKKIKLARQALYGAVKCAQFTGIQDTCAQLLFEPANGIFCDILSKEENKQMLEQVISDVFDMPLSVSLNVNRPQDASISPDLLKTAGDLFGSENVETM